MSIPPNRLRTPTPVLPAVDPAWARRQRRKARALSVARWLGGAAFVGLALLFGHHFHEMPQALTLIGVAGVAYLATVQPWRKS